MMRLIIAFLPRSESASKRLVRGGIAASGLLGGILLFCLGRDTCSYLWTAVHSVREEVRENIPLSVELNRAHKMIEQLVPEIQQNMHLIAAEEVQVDRLRHQVTELQEELLQDEQEIRQLQSSLDRGESHYYFAGVNYSRDQVCADLARRFERFQANEDMLQNLQKVMHAREQGLAAANERLVSMRAARRELNVEIETLEARMKMVEVAQTTSEFNFDESHLTRTRELIDRIDTRMEVAEKLLDTQPEFQDEIPLEAENADISDQIDEYFSHHSGP